MVGEPLHRHQGLGMRARDRNGHRGAKENRRTKAPRRGGGAKSE